MVDQKAMRSCVVEQVLPDENKLRLYNWYRCKQMSLRVQITVFTLHTKLAYR